MQSFAKWRKVKTQFHEETPCYYHERVRDILKGKDGDGNDVHVFRMRENERVQLGVDAVKDPKKRGILTDNFRASGITLEKGLRTLFHTSPGQPHIIDCILMNEGIDPNRHFIDDLAPGSRNPDRRHEVLE